MNLEEVKIQVTEVGVTASNFIRNEFYKFDKSNIRYKGANNVVSFVDENAEKLIVDRLRKILPQAGFLAEEGTNTDANANHKQGYYWIIDPLDGTTNFVHGIPFFSTSIGLILDGEPILGFVSDIVRKKHWVAAKGLGAHDELNAPIGVSPEENIENGLYATGFPYTDFDLMEKYIEVFRYFFQQTHGVRRIGSAALDLVLTATGAVEGFFEYGLNPWDVAAGIVLVREAGGTVTDFNGNDNALFGREIIAAGSTHKQVVDVFNSRWK